MAMLGHSVIPHHHDVTSLESFESHLVQEYPLKGHSILRKGRISDQQHKTDLHRHLYEIKDPGHAHNRTDLPTHAHFTDYDQKKDIEEEHHNHSFPIHYHFSESGEFEFTRIVNGTTYNAPLNQLDYQSMYSNSADYQDPLFTTIRYLHINQVLKNPIFKSNANCLRAPPAFA